MTVSPSAVVMVAVVIVIVLVVVILLGLVFFSGSFVVEGTTSFVL